MTNRIMRWIEDMDAMDAMDRVVELFEGYTERDRQRYTERDRQEFLSFVKDFGRENKLEKEIDMDKQDFVTEMKKAAEMAEDDPEVGHIIADNLMASTLARIGYHEGVKLFYRMNRSYS